MEIPPGLNLASAGAQSQSLQRRNLRLAWRLLLVAVFFAGFGFALVPLYDAVCRWTGFNGRTNASPAALAANTQVDVSRSVKVEFLSHSMPGVGLQLTPAQFSLPVHPGEVIHTHYVVKNLSDRVVTGQAIPSITPAVATPYFQKIECFCFNQQTLQPGEERTLPVVFVVNPELDHDLGTITLSYTFFEAPKPRV